MIKAILYLIICFLITSCYRSNKSNEITLQINQWKFCYSDTTFPAKVPGEIHKDLLINGLIENPYYQCNEEKYKWIADSTWVYLSEFNLDKKVLDYNNISLVFEGLDTYAKVFLNDSLILSTNNMFRKYSVNVKEILKSNNILKVIFDSPKNINLQKQSQLSYKLPDKRAFTRKAPYQFGWDWGPEIITCGIIKPVYIKAWNDFTVNDFSIRTIKIEKNKAFMVFNADISTNKEEDININIIDKNADKLIVNKKLHIDKGQNRLKFNFNIEEPVLWWCNGYGEPFLYEFSIDFITQNKKIIKKLKAGIREIKLIQEQDSIGESFVFSLNHQKVFIKGANYVPMDNFLTDVNKGRYRKLLTDVKESNMNMIRVWGGGIFESDYFYSLCDSLGIMVWQDFMFSCNMYPGDKDFIANVHEEVVQQIKRISKHPCLALWCGNNEIENGWFDWGWQKQLNYTKEDSLEIWKNYNKLFYNVIANIVKEYTPEINYYPSSPKYGWGHKESNTHGDSHYWGVWWGKEPFDMYKYKTGRFMSEYGFQAYPVKETILSFSNNADNASLFCHQKHPEGFEIIDKYLEHYYFIPDNIDSKIYLSQLMQAEGIKTAIVSHRLAKPKCMGTMYWQLNDCWPAISWSSIDYYGRWKALQYYVKKYYKPFIISGQIRDTVFDIFAVSDYQEEFEIKLISTLQDFYGNIIYVDTVSILIPPDYCGKIHSVTFPNIDRYNKNNLFINSIVIINHDTIFEDNFFFCAEKELKLPDDVINKTCFKTDSGLIVSLISPVFMKSVYMHSAEFNDYMIENNWSDLIPGRKTKYYVKGVDINSIHLDSIKITSLNKENNNHKH